MTTPLSERIKYSPQPKLDDVIFDSSFRTLLINGQPDLSSYLFGPEGNGGKLHEILKIVLGETHEEKIEMFQAGGQIYTKEYKRAHNCATIFKNIPKVFPAWKSRDSPVTKKLIEFAQLTKQPSSVYCNHFCTVLTKLVVDASYIDDKPELFYALITHPNWAGYSSMIFYIIKSKPEFYEILSKRTAEFMRYAISRNDKDFAQCSFLLLDVFSLLIKSGEIDCQSISVEIVKNILDVALSSYDFFPIAFYDGIFIVSSLIAKEPSNDDESRHMKAVKKYVKVRGEAFYSSLKGLSKDLSKITKKDIKGDLEKAIRAFPAFVASGWNQYKFFLLMFNKENVITSEFNRACLDYIISFDQDKYQDFIDKNNIVNLIKQSIPPFPSDPQVLESPENISYLNPYVIMLALYIFDGLPAQRGTGNPEIKKNPFTSDSTKSEEFVKFMIEQVLPYKKVMFPDLSAYNLLARTQRIGD